MIENDVQVINGRIMCPVWSNGAPEVDDRVVTGKMQHWSNDCPVLLDQLIQNFSILKMGVGINAEQVVAFPCNALLTA